MTNLQTPRIRTLDGWRAIAIIMVLANHVLMFTRYSGLLGAQLGSFGVDIFFVISGYIITLQFLKERERFSTISLRSFYLRRVFRILPLVVVYLSTICVLAFFMNLVDFHGSEILGSLFFFRNYQYAANPTGVYTSHFWSLSIEEHFYLLWPALFLWQGNRRSLWIALIGAASCATWRAYTIAYPYNWLESMLPGLAGRVRRTDTRFDGLMLGCALAILLFTPQVRNFVFRSFPKETPLVMAMLLIMNLARTPWPTLTNYVLVCVILASTLVVEEGVAYKWLNWRPLVWIGTISYSIYIWQQLFLQRPDAVTFPMGRLSMFPYNLICTIAISALSYYFLEKPCIALGKRLIHSRKKSATVEV